MHEITSEKSRRMHEIKSDFVRAYARNHIGKKMLVKRRKRDCHYRIIFLIAFEGEKRQYKLEWYGGMVLERKAKIKA